MDAQATIERRDATESGNVKTCFSTHFPIVIQTFVV